MSRSYDRLYRLFHCIKRRCYDKKHKGYKYYGGKGIKVCDEWLNDFEKFKIWALSKGYDYNAPKGQCTIDRINPNGNYEPSNCRFITLKENDSRVIRQAKKYTYNGETHTLKEWAKIKKWSVDCLYGRLHRGMSFEEAITTQFDNKHKIKEDKSE